MFFELTTWIWILMLPLAVKATQFIRMLLRMYEETNVLKKDFPQPEGTWLWGSNFPGPNKHGLKWLIDNAVKHPRYYLLVHGPFKSKLLLNHPETIKQLLKTAEPKQLNIDGFYRMAKPWIGDGLLTSNGPTWARSRKLLQGAVHFDALKPYVPVYNDAIDATFEKLDKTLEKSPSESIEIYDVLTNFALDIISRTVFSGKVVDNSEHKTYIDAIVDIGNLLFRRFMTPLLFFDFLYYRTEQGKKFLEYCDISHEKAEGIIKNRKEEHSESETQRKLAKKKRHDLLDILLLAKDENKVGLSGKEIRDHVETFMAAGFDTTSSGLVFILYNLAKNPDYQDRARKEVDALFENKQHVDDWITWDDLSDLTYLTRCIKESLRLYPPVPFVARTLTKPMQIDDKVIAPGTTVAAGVWNMHHNPEVWTNPWTYDPDRFLPENLANMDSHCFLSFSAGPRNCMGQNFAMNLLRTVTTRFLRKYNFSIDESKPFEVSLSTKIRPEEPGLFLYLSKRQDV